MSGPAGLPRPRGIRFASAVFVAGLVVAGFIGGGSYWYWQVEKKDEVQSQRALQEMRARLDTIKRERDDLRGSEVTYKSLIERGAFAAEQRLDLIEAMTVLKKRHRLVSLEYDLFPQRPLKVTAASYAAADVRARSSVSSNASGTSMRTSPTSSARSSPSTAKGTTPPGSHASG